MTYDEFRKKLTDSLVGSYIFYGDEDYLKKSAVDSARRVFVKDETLAAFCHTIIDDGDLERLRGEISAPAMFFGSRLIEIYLLEPDKMKASEFEDLCGLLKANESALVIAVIAPGKLSSYQSAKLKAEKKGKKDKDDKADESSEKKQKDQRPRKEILSNCATLVEFEKQSSVKLAKWARAHISSYGLSAQQETISYLIEFCGTDMFILNSEINKLCSYVKAREKQEITKEDIAKACSSYTEIGTFDFTNAILNRDRKSAMRIFADMKARREPVQIILASVVKILGELLSVKTAVMSGMSNDLIMKELKMKEYPLKLRMNAVSRVDLSNLTALLERCYEVDVSSKSTGLDGYTMLERLILSI